MNVQRHFFIGILAATAAPLAFGQEAAPRLHADPSPQAGQGREGTTGGRTQNIASIPDFSGIWAHPYFPGFEPPASGPEAPWVRKEHRHMGGRMTNHRALLHLTLAIAAATLGSVTAGRTAELDPAAIAYVTPDQFKWRDPTDQVATNQAILHGDPNKPELYIYINKFKPGRFGNPHYHPNDRFITVLDGAAWRRTRPPVDPTHSTPLPNGT